MSWKTKACPTLGTNLMCTGATTVTAWLLCLAKQNDRRTARRHGHTAAGRQAGRRHARSAAVSHVSARSDRVASGAGRCDGTGGACRRSFPGWTGSVVLVRPRHLGSCRCDAKRRDGCLRAAVSVPWTDRTLCSALLPSQMTRRSVRPSARGLPSKPGKATVPFRSVLLRVMNWRAAGLLCDQVEAVRQVVLPG